MCQTTVLDSSAYSALSVNDRRGGQQQLKCRCAVMPRRAAYGCITPTCTSLALTCVRVCRAARHAADGDGHVHAWRGQQRLCRRRRRPVVSELSTCLAPALSLHVLASSLLAPPPDAEPAAAAAVLALPNCCFLWASQAPAAAAAVRALLACCFLWASRTPQGVLPPPANLAARAQVRRHARRGAGSPRRHAGHQRLWRARQLRSLRLSADAGIRSSAQ